MGFPDATTTGPAAAGYTSLTPQTAEDLGPSGPYPSWVTVSEDGSLLVEGCSFTAAIHCQPDNLTFRGCRFTVADSDDAAIQNLGGTNLAVEYCQISAPSITQQLQYCVLSDGDGATIDHCNFFWWSDAVQIGSGDDITITDNYIHDPVFYTGDHTDGVQFSGSQSDITVTGNTILNSADQTSALAFFQDNDPQDGYDTVLVQGNLLGGGGYPLYAGTGGDGPVTNFVVQGNSFSMEFFPSGGQFGVVADQAAWGSDGNVWAGNEWYSMTWALAGSDVTHFSDGSGGHAYTLPGGAPDAGDLDILCVNVAGDVASTPDGFTLGPSSSDLSYESAYIFYRFAAGGEGDSVTVTTGSDVTTMLAWARFTGGSAADQDAAEAHSGSASNSPTVTTPDLAQTGELSVAFTGLYNGDTAPTSPSWSAAYMPVTTSGVPGGTLGSLTGYNADAGTAAESPTVNWTNAFAYQAILVQTFEPYVPPADDGGEQPGGGNVAPRRRMRRFRPSESPMPPAALRIPASPAVSR